MLPLWIESWLSVPWINNIFLVDGGSADRSVEIAKSYDRVKVNVVPWRNDFSRQRNIAIKFAKSKWLLQADIDEIPCGNLEDKYIEILLGRENINQIAIPYIKFYDFNKLWLFIDGNTPRLKKNLVEFGFKSTVTIFRRDHLSGYQKSLHEMPLLSGKAKIATPCVSGELALLKSFFLIGHYDQAKHFEQARKNKTTVELEMGLKRARYRLITPVSYGGKVYDKSWAEQAISQYQQGNPSMIEELGHHQLGSFKRQHEILENYDALNLNNDKVKERLENEIIVQEK